MHLKLFKRTIQKTAESSGDFIRNKIADKITRVSKASLQNNSETNEEEVLREIYIYIYIYGKKNTSRTDSKE